MGMETDMKEIGGKMCERAKVEEGFYFLGTLECSSGDKYQGQWQDNMKEGKGDEATD